MFNWRKKKRKNTNDDDGQTPINLSEYALSIEALKHSKSYSELLVSYVKTTKRNSYIKDILKTLFFAITIGALAFIVWIFYDTLKYAFNFFGNIENIGDISLESIFSMITVILPAISSLIVAFIKIPEIIAKYLFNIQEDIYMNSIIKNIQDHDQSMFAMEHKINVTLAENKTDSMDDNFESSPKEDDDFNNKKKNKA